MIEVQLVNCVHHFVSPSSWQATILLLLHFTDHLFYREKFWIGSLVFQVEGLLLSLNLSKLVLPPKVLIVELLLLDFFDNLILSISTK